jgi:hypothetical protein
LLSRCRAFVRCELRLCVATEPAQAKSLSVSSAAGGDSLATVLKIVGEAVLAALGNLNSIDVLAHLPIDRWYFANYVRVVCDFFCDFARIAVFTAGEPDLEEQLSL